MGQLIRILVILLVVWLVIGAIRRLIARRPDTQVPAVSEMLQCAHCGVHIPKSQVVRARDRVYCSREHLQADTEAET